MKQFKSLVVITMVFAAISCDEKNFEDQDASIAESCVLYAATGMTEEGGDGTSADRAISSMEDVMERLQEITPSCKDAAEVRFAEGSLSDEQFAMVKESLRLSGVSTNKYNNETLSMPIKERTKSLSSVQMPVKDNETTSIEERFPDMREGAAPGDVYTPRASTSPWWEESGTTNNIFYNTGNVAIGAAVSATTKLQISGAESGKTDGSIPTGALRLESSNAQYMFLDGNEIDVYGKTSPWNGTALHLNYNSKGNVTIAQNGGNVGVGVAPTSNITMTVKGIGISSTGANGSLRINDNASSTANYLLLDGNEINGANGLHLNAKFNKAVYIAADNSKNDNGDYKNNAIVYLVRNNGKVAIGDLTSAQTTHKLTVDGVIKAEGIVIDTVGADFVFENDYELMTLEDVERYIEKHKHLPGIASAKKMQKEGLELGEFQIRLLQKIEELTLYTIEQNKRMQELETTIMQMRAANTKEGLK